MNLEKERTYIKSEVAKDIARYSKSPISCGVGCSGCCHVQVGVFKEEVDNILSLGIEIDMDHLEKQVTDWNNSDKTCVFIKDGNCSIHDNKPLSCTSHLVNTPKSYCVEGSKKAPHMVRTKTVQERLKELRKDNPTLILHQELHKRLN